MTLDWTEALRRESAEVTRFLGQLTDAEWRADSACEGWRVQDVVAHMGGGVHSLFTPAGAKLLFSKDVERTNDEMVERRYTWSPAEVFGEFQLWSARTVRLAGLVTRTPLAGAPVPLAELGRFPLALILGGALVFDQHCHLRHDIAPVLGRPVPGTDELRMECVLAWMLAVLSNQLKAAAPGWLDRPLGITLDGPGGGSWRVGTDYAVTPGEAADAAARIAGVALEFPSWGTRRSPWREQQVTVTGDEEYGARFLDAMNVV